MSELIKVTTNEKQEQVVSARGLYQELGIKKRFSEWWTTNSKGFGEGIDYTPYLEVHPQNKQHIQNYAMLLDMAKHLAIQTQSEKGFEVRTYFIEVEKRYKQPIPLTIREQAKLALAANEETNERVDAVVKDVEYLKSEVRLESSNYSFIGKRVSQKINEVIQGRSLNPKAQAPLRKELNGDIATLVGVRTRTQIKEKDFDRVVDFIDRWQPSTLAMDIVRQLELELEVKGLGGIC